MCLQLERESRFSPANFDQAHIHPHLFFGPVRGSPSSYNPSPGAGVTSHQALKVPPLDQFPHLPSQCTSAATALYHIGTAAGPAVPHAARLHVSARCPTSSGTALPGTPLTATRTCGCPEVATAHQKAAARAAAAAAGIPRAVPAHEPGPRESGSRPWGTEHERSARLCRIRAADSYHHHHTSPQHLLQIRGARMYQFMSLLPDPRPRIRLPSRRSCTRRAWRRCSCEEPGQASG